MKKVLLSSLLLLASSAFGITFEKIILTKFTTGMVPGTRMEYSTFYPLILTEQRKDGLLLGILDVKTVDETLKECVRKELKEYWIGKVKSVSASGSPSRGGLIPVIEIPIKFPAPIAGIFGEGGRLEIGGSQSITFGGSKNYTVEAVPDPNLRQTWFPDLKMEQHLKVNVKGTIGEKLSVDVDHDSKAQTELKNKIKLAYTGREDEIVQKVEAGDISLSLPSTRYSSVSGTHKGLFGIKAFNQVGPLNITAIASKEQGEASSEEYTGYGAKVESLRVIDYQYVQKKFYWLGEEDTIVSLEVFREVKDLIQGQSYIEAKAWIDPTDTTYYADLSYQAHFEQLVQGEDYIFNPPHSIELIFPIQEEQALAVYYTTKSGTVVGNLESSPKILKLIKSDLRTPWYVTPESITVVNPTWEYELKNFYSLGGGNIIDTSISVSIWKEVSGAPDIELDPDLGKTYLELFGLDQNGDGRIELQWVHNNKYLFFPSPKPFFYLPDGSKLSDPDSAIYYETNFNRLNPKYYIVIQYQTSHPTISLPRINILEGSEVVRIGEEVWQRGKDYDIDYPSGTITLKRVPPANQRIFIDYQWAPLISLASKTLLGIRTAYKLSDIGEIGSTFLFRSVTTPTEKPKPGEEPTRNMLGEIDGNFRFETGFLTSLANRIPLVSTDKPSELSISGEVAASFPNPNTRDQAYLDDMEGTSITQSFPINFKAWIYGSVPVGKDTASFASKPIRWYNPENGVRAGDIHEGLPEGERERRETILQLEFEPDDTTSWVSLSTLISPTRIDLRNYSFLEVWVKGDTGKLIVDLAPKLSEDGIRRDALGRIVGYGVFDTEDKEPRDGILDWDEDTGLDGVSGTDGARVSGDDGNDDYKYSFGSGDYSRVNGTEGNQKLDTEDLDGNKKMDEKNSYFEYTIDLADTLFQEKRTQAGWKLYRIPLKKGKSVWEEGSGLPDSASVKYGRIWITGAQSKVIIQIYSIEIVGNRWISEGVSREDTLSDLPTKDENFYVEVVSNVYDTTYVPPFDPGVDRYGRPMRESSLRLIYENIRPGHKASCYRTIIDPNARDYTNYNNMALWLKKESGYPVDFFIRFGSDSLNYYEVRKTVSHSGWEELKIELKELPLIKHSVYDTTSSIDLEYSVGGLGFKGKPSLTSVQWISLGIINADSTIEYLTGKLYVNELRLTSPKRKIGVAANLKLTTKLADLLVFSLNTERKDSEFRTLAQTSTRGATSTTNSYSMSSTINLHKFGLESFSIPLSISMSKRLGLPKYGVGNDVELEPDQRWREKTESSQLSYSLNLSKSASSQNRLVKVVLDPIKVGLNRSYSITNTPNKKDSVYSFSSSFSYSYSPKLEPINLRLFRLSYFPKSIRLAGKYTNSYSQSLTKTDTLVTVTRAQNPRIVDYSLDLGYSPISSISSSYSFSSKRDLRRPYLYRNMNVGKEWQRSQSLTVNYDLPIPIFKPHASYSVAYGESRYIEYPTPEDSIEILKVSSSKKIGSDLSLDIFGIFNKLSWLKFISKLRNVISTPKFSYSRSQNSQFFGLFERPSFFYQFGIKENIGEIDKKYDSRDQQKISDVYSINLGISFWKLSLRGGGEKRKSENLYPSVPLNNTWSTTTVWPQLTLDVNLLGLVSPLGKLCNSVSFTSGFSIQQEKSGARTVLKSTQITRSLTPSIRLSFKKGINTSVSYRFSKKVDQRYDLGKKRTEQRGDGLDLSLSYSFSAPTGIKLPLFHRIRFKSNLDVSLTGSWGQDMTTQSVPGEEPINATNTTNFSIRPSFSYRFSSAVSGNLRAWFSQRRDRKRATTNRDLGLDLSATFRF